MWCISGVKVQLCKQPTNGISYFTALLDFSQLPADLNVYVPLFCSVLTEIGAGDLSYRDFAQQTELCAGEFSSSTSLVINHSDVSQFNRSAMLRSFSLERNTDKMFELWTKLFNEPRLEDKDRLKTLILNVRCTNVIFCPNVSCRFKPICWTPSLHPATRMPRVGQLPSWAKLM